MEDIEKVVGEEVKESVGRKKPHALTPKERHELKETRSGRDELGQREQTYKKYHEGVGYNKLSSDELGEAIGTVYVARTRSGKVCTQPKFRSGAELLGAIDAYWDFMKESMEQGHTIVPDTEGLASFLRCDRCTLMGWAKGNTNPEFAPILAQTFNDIAAVKKQLAMKNAIPALVYLSDMQNNHGYVSNTNKIDIDVTARREPDNPQTLIDNAKLLP